MPIRVVVWGNEVNILSATTATVTVTVTAMVRVGVVVTVVLCKDKDKDIHSLGQWDVVTMI